MKTTHSPFLNPRWPVLQSFADAHLRAVALPLGGIGTGAISLGGRGDLRDWEIANHTAKGFRPGLGFLALRAQVASGRPVARLLQGPLDDALCAGTCGSPEPLAGMPRFTAASFATAYPLAQVLFEDAALPLDVRLEAFNPLVPADLDASSWPVAVLRVVVRNRSDEDVACSCLAACDNIIGTEPWTGKLTARWPFPRRNSACRAAGLVGVQLSAEAPVDARDERLGTLALAMFDNAGTLDVATRWREQTWRNEGLAEAWARFRDHGRIEEPPQTSDAAALVATLVAGTVLRPGQEHAFTILIAWHFPNRHAWAWPTDPAEPPPAWIGNHYTGRFADAWDAAARFAQSLPELEARTVDWVSAFCASPWPHTIKEAALANASTLRTPVLFRTPDGHFFGWEGGHNARVIWNCLGTPPHVWHYETTTAFLFGEIARSMRETNFRHMLDSEGGLRTRVLLPLADEPQHPLIVADSQLGALLMLWRDWRLSGDTAWVRTLWPAARRSLEFCWRPGGWDADRDGVMEGCQHNTLDTEYLGPNPLIAFLYLAALRAVADLAEAMGEPGFAGECRRLERLGAARVEDRLWNGEFYRQVIRTDLRPGTVDPRLYTAPSVLCERPPHQLGGGCLIDQLLGVFLAEIYGLGEILPRERVRDVLCAIFRNNHRPQLGEHANHLRSFALQDEAATLMVSYPRGEMPPDAVPYWAEAMTGFEHLLAAHLMQAGLQDEGLAVADAVRARHDGRRRNPFDEPEWGHHYARAMSAWSQILAYTGFRWCALTGEMRFGELVPGSHFWSTGFAWGVVVVPADTEQPPTLVVREGRLPWTRLLVGSRPRLASTPKVGVRLPHLTR